VLDNSNTLEVSGEEGKDTATGYFTLFNPSDKATPIEVKFQAASSEKLTVDKVTPELVPPGEAQRVGVTFSGMENLDAAVSGQLVVLGGVTPVAQAVKVSPAPRPDMPWAEVLIGVSFFIAAFLALAVVGAMESTASLRNAAPGPKWSFDSWATTLTGAGAIFGTVLAEVTLPSFTEQFSKETLTNLSLFFGILVVLAPFIFQATRRRTPVTTAEEEERVGTNLTLLIACTITLWAVLGQLGTFALLGWELIGDEPLRWVAMLAILLIAGLAVRYFLITASLLVRRDWTPPPPTTSTAGDGAGEILELLEEEGAFDTSEIDRLYFNREGIRAVGVQMVREPENRSARVEVQAPPPAPRNWSLL